MRLDELERIFEDTTADHWSLVEAGPTFLHGFTVEERPGKSARISNVDEHQRVAVLRTDIDVRIGWGYDPDQPDDPEEAVFPRETFSDSTESVQLADVFYRGALVLRHNLISVDGYRAVLPLPTPALKAPDESGRTRRRLRPESYELTATARAMHVARLVDDLHGHRSFEHYLTRSGIVIR